MGWCNINGWCSAKGWTVSTTKWDGWCNTGILVQQDELLKRNGTVQQLWLVQCDGMDSQHDEMRWMVQQDGMDSWQKGTGWMVQQNRSTMRRDG